MSHLDAAKAYFDKKTTKQYRKNLMYQLADLANKLCKPGETVVSIANLGDEIEVSPAIRVLTVTIRRADNTTHEVELEDVVRCYNKNWLDWMDSESP